MARAALNPVRPADPDKDIKPTKGHDSLIIDLAMWLFPCIECCVCGNLVGGQFGFGWGLSLMLVLIWSAIYYRIGFMQIEQQDFVRLHRFGRFYTVKYRGWRWRNWFFDRIEDRGSFKARSYALYPEKKDEDKIDFQDVSTHINAVAWYSNCNPVDVAKENWEALTRQIALNAFRFIKPDMRAAELIDSALRPRLETLTTDEAKGLLGKAACKEAIDSVRSSLAAIGIYPPEHDPLVVRDIQLTKKQEESRDKAMEGAAQAKQQAQSLTGPALAVDQIIKHAQSLGESVTYAEAVEMVNQAQANQTLRETKSNVSIVATGMAGVMNALMINPRGS